MTEQELLMLAVKAKDMSYSPYSKFKVGAALLCEDGSVFTGCNVENISYGGTICAERTAFVKAISEGKRHFLKIAISVSGEEYGMPCGICRQFMSEFVSDNFSVICANSEDEYVIFNFSKLYPLAFKAELNVLI